MERHELTGQDRGLINQAPEVLRRNYDTVCRMLPEYCPDVPMIVSGEEGRPIGVPAQDLMPFA